MTVQAQVPRINHIADGVQDTFAYDFLVLDESHLEVYEDNVLTTLAYTVTETEIGNPAGGTIVFDPDVPAFNIIVTLLRNVPITQETDYQPYDPFPAETHEAAIDKLTQISQQQQDEIDRTLKANIDTPVGVSYSLPIPETNKGLYWNDDPIPTAIVNGPTVQEIKDDKNAAAASAAAAATSASESATSAAAALVSETNAAASETNAATSETNAATSETNAATSETNAATSAAAALVSENNAATSETNAAASETNAATSETNAETAQAASEIAQTAAELAETNAETAQAASEAAYDSFDDRYLGPKASDPTLDNDGDALIDGALYFDTTANLMKVYDLGTTTWLTGYVPSNFYVAKAGDTMTGTLVCGDDLSFSSRVTTDGHIHLYNGTSPGGYALGVESNATYYRSASFHRWYIGTLADGGVSNKMQLSNTGLTIAGSTVTAGGNTVWHAGNDGDGSGLDADLLDGQHGSYYQRAVADRTNLELNINGSGNRYAFMDFHGDDTYVDYSLRILRGNTGPNANSEINHRGTGAFKLTLLDGGIFTVDGSEVWNQGNVGARINALTADTSPVSNTDYIMTYDASASGAKKVLLEDLSPGGFDAGMEMFWPGATAPTGWFEEDGSAISRTTYSDLFAVIGTMYGVGDGSTTFNLPDPRGRTIRVWDNGAGIDPDAASRTDRGDGTTGDNVGTNQADDLLSHRHTISGSYANGSTRVDIGTNATGRTAYTNYTGGNETRMVNTNRMMVIKY